MRALPLACGIAALFLFWALAERVVSGWAATFATGLFSLGMPLVYFSSQLKQYSSDVAVSTLLWLAVVDVRRRGVNTRRAWLLGALGAAVVWCSQPALFVLAGLGASLAIVVWLERDGPAARALAITGALWGLSAAAAAFHSLSILTESDRQYFRWFWSEGFMPMPPRTLVDALWVVRKLTWAFGAFGSGRSRTHGGLNYRWSWVFTAVMLVGLWALWRRRRDVALFLSLPIVIVATLSAVDLYPFTARLFLFLLPGLLLATAAGAEYLVASPLRRVPLFVPALLGVLGGAPIYAAATTLPPFWTQHLRPIVERIAAETGPSDRIYVYFGAAQAFHYYAPRFGVPMNQVLIGRCAVGHPRDYLQQIDALRGASRAWIIVTHAQRDGTETRLLVQYADQIGRRLAAIELPGTGGSAMEDAFGYLYDFSDRDRLASTSADSQVIPPGLVSEPPGPWDCYGVGLSESSRLGRF